MGPIIRLPTLADSAPTEPLDAVRAARRLPAGTYLIGDASGLTALQIQQQAGPTSHRTALVEVPLGTQVAAEQLIGVLVGLGVLPQSPAEVAALYARLGLSPDHAPPPPAAAPEAPAPWSATIVDAVPSAAAPPPTELAPDSDAVPSAAAPPPTELAPDSDAVSSAAAPSADDVALEACGYGTCPVHKQAGRPIHIHRSRVHGLPGGRLPSAPAASAAAAPAPPADDRPAAPETLLAGSAPDVAAGASPQAADEPPPNF